MALIDLRYLWLAQDRSRIYWYYRRNEQLILITSPNGDRLFLEDAGLREAYHRIHASFEKEAPKARRKLKTPRTRGAGWEDFINGAD